jgi:hypothetical protein
MRLITTIAAGVFATLGTALSASAALTFTAVPTPGATRDAYSVRVFSDGVGNGTLINAYHFEFAITGATNTPSLDKAHFAVLDTNNNGTVDSVDVFNLANDPTVSTFRPTPNAQCVDPLNDPIRGGFFEPNPYANGKQFFIVSIVAGMPYPDAGVSGGVELLRLVVDHGAGFGMYGRLYDNLTPTGTVIDPFIVAPLPEPTAISLVLGSVVLGARRTRQRG